MHVERAEALSAGCKRSEKGLNSGFVSLHIYVRKKLYFHYSNYNFQIKNPHPLNPVA